MDKSTAKARPSFSEGARVALLKTVNRMFTLDPPIDSLDDLHNGLVLGKVLHELDPEFDPSHLEKDQTVPLLTNKRNIQSVYKGLFRFIRRKVPELSFQASKFDYHAIAESPDAQGISQLLAVIVCTAAFGPNRQQYVPRIQHLDQKAQGELMHILQVVQMEMADAKGAADDTDEAVDDVLEARDIDLLVEEQNAALRQQLDTTKKQLSDYITRLEKLHQSHSELQYEKDKNDRELDLLRKATRDGASNADTVKALEARVHEQMEIIADYEETMREDAKVKAHLESEVQRLTNRAALAESLQDQVAEWKHKAEEFEKKANTADRYKQKLEQHQGDAKELSNLKYERAELQDEIQRLTGEILRSQRVHKADAELSTLISQSEQAVWDERNAKNLLRQDLEHALTENAQLQALRDQDEVIIKELNDRLQGGEGSSMHQGGDAGMSLEDELNDANDGAPAADFSLANARLKAENEVLKRTVASKGDTTILQRDLDVMTAHRDRLQAKTNDDFEKIAILNAQVEAVLNNLTGEGDKAFAELRQADLEKADKLEKAQKRIEALEQQAADQARELVTLRTDLEAVDKDAAQALEDIKHADEIVSASLKSELDRLREKLGIVTADNDAQKSQLIEALLAKDRLSKAAEGKTLDEIMATDPDLAAAAKKETEKIEKLRARLVERNEQLEKSELERVDLQRKLKAALGGDLAAEQKAALEKTIKNLQRENALMATAWFDLTGRIQSNLVVLQRRHDAPKSWLNKQRQMVNGQLRRRDSLYLY
ncbi:uncharacterized protein F5Z01DRAFT_616727 [Emericellopsis atlantica]|uniref:HOOK N-terminal domain-containing protein n=1 Tax=Emericellopsis atlantica TaxID=2614577 RepID=A0A9P7ZTQ2_9HYPO|nr:uncharacterized protein F5Z01DRAFT_616727 [Emericellopsis atlantica]KAG9257646.1 hypothetical protein F5Z01DRAFT_616727 [Emericellopsis atlantica]